MVLSCNSGDKKCQDAYLANAWLNFNKKYQEFQVECKTNSDMCDYQNMMPHYEKLLEQIEEVLLAMKNDTAKDPVKDQGAQTLKNLRSEIMQKMSQLKKDEDSGQGKSMDIEMIYDRTFYVHFLWILILTFLILAVLAFAFSA
jgi:hypothetical protein